MKILVAAAVLVLAGCGSGQVEDIASQAASAAAGEVKDQASQLTGPVCDGLSQVDKNLASLAQGKAETVGQAKQQVAEAQTNLEQTAQEGNAASKVVLAGVTAGLEGLTQSLASLKDDAAVPESITQAADALESTISQAEDSLGC